MTLLGNVSLIMSSSVSTAAGASNAAAQPSPAPPPRAPTSAAPQTAGAPGAQRRHSFSGVMLPPTPEAAAAAALAELAARTRLATLDARAQSAAEPSAPRAAAHTERAPADYERRDLEHQLLRERHKSLRLELELQRMRTPAPPAAPATARVGGSGDGPSGRRQSAPHSEVEEEVELNISPGTPGQNRSGTWAGAYATPLLPSSANRGAPRQQIIVHTTMMLKQPPAAPKLDDEKFRKDIDKV